MAFPQYKENVSATKTVLPAVFLPTTLRRKPKPTANVSLPPLNSAHNYEKFPFKLTTRKKTFRNGVALSAVQELTVTPSSEQQSARRNKSKRYQYHLDDEKSEMTPYPPKIHTGHCDENNFSVKNIYETQPGMFMCLPT